MNCGTEVDKWGRQIARSEESHDVSESHLSISTHNPIIRRVALSTAAALLYLFVRIALDWSVVSANISKGQFIAGLVPSLLDALLFIIFFEIIIRLIKRNYTKTSPKENDH
jgi:hypothetical protein